MHLFCYQKVATRSRSVSVHSDFSYDASRAHRRGCGDNSKNGHFLACHHEAYNALRTIRMLTKLCWGVRHGHWVDFGDQQGNIKLLR